MAGENNNGGMERGHITIDLKNINLETLIDVVNKIDVEKLSAALSILGVKQDNKTNMNSKSDNLTNTEDTEKKLKLEMNSSASNEGESEETQFEPIEGTEDTKVDEERNVREQSKPAQAPINSPKQNKASGQNVPQNQISGSSDTGRDHTLYKADNSKNNGLPQNDYRTANDKEKTAITANPSSKQSAQKNVNPANQLIQAITAAQGKNNKSKSGSGSINIQENPSTMSAASRPVMNTSGNAMNKKIEILNAIKPMLDYERYQILDNIIKIYSLRKFL